MTIRELLIVFVHVLQKKNNSNKSQRRIVALSARIPFSSSSSSAVRQGDRDRRDDFQ